MSLLLTQKNTSVKYIMLNPRFDFELLPYMHFIERYTRTVNLCPNMQKTFLLKTSIGKEEKKRGNVMGWNYPVFWYAPRGNTVHRYDLQLKGPKEETFGLDALHQRGSFPTAGVQSNCWLLGVFTSSLLLYLHKCCGCPCTCLCQPKGLCGPCTLSLSFALCCPPCAGDSPLAANSTAQPGWRQTGFSPRSTTKCLSKTPAVWK